MYGAISKCILSRRQPLSILKNGCSTAAFLFPKEINSVKLMGSIEGEEERMPNGSINFHLKSWDNSSSYSVHKVTVANLNLLGRLPRKLTANQRFFVTGKLQTDNVIVEEKRHQEIKILAMKMHSLDPIDPAFASIQVENDRVHQFDRNFVEMMASIGSRVQNEETFAVFSLKTHYTEKKGESDELISSDLHKVIVPNNPRLLEKAKNLQKGDRVYVRGRIGYSNKEHPVGNEYVTGYILLQKIVKLV